MRRPGLLTRFTEEIAGSWFSPYLRVKRMYGRFATSTISAFSTNFSVSRIFAIANFIFESGTSTEGFVIFEAFRMRESMSEIGSVIIGLPACFFYPRDLTAARQFSEADAAKAKGAHEESLASTSPAPIHLA